jgi:hypothetical protein
MENLSLNVIFLSPFVGIAKMLQGSVNQNIFFSTVISFICALISKHNARLGHKPSSIPKFTLMHETWIGIENYETVTMFCGHHSMHSPKCMRFFYVPYINFVTS